MLLAPSPTEPVAFTLCLFLLPELGLDESTEVRFFSLLSMLDCIEFRMTEAAWLVMGAACLFFEPLLPLLN